MVISVNENTYRCDTYEEYEICIDKAIQGPKLLRLTLTEEVYSAYVDGFYSARQ